MKPLRLAALSLSSTAGAIVLATGAMLTPSVALADASGASGASNPQDFIRTEQATLTGLLKQAESPDRNAKLSRELDLMVDYDELSHRTFGHPCPAAVPSCHDHWADLTDAQHAEVVGLLRKLIEKNYRKNLIKTLNYDVTVKLEKDVNGEAKVTTEAQKRDSRDPAVQIDYQVRGTPGNYKVVDIITERSSMAKNYYDQFHRMLTTPDQGYPFLVGKLQQQTKKE